MPFFCWQHSVASANASMLGVSRKGGRADGRPHKEQWLIFYFIFGCVSVGKIFFLLHLTLADLLSRFHMIVRFSREAAANAHARKAESNDSPMEREEKNESIQRSIGFESFLSVDQLTIH